MFALSALVAFVFIVILLKTSSALQSPSSKFLDLNTVRSSKKKVKKFALKVMIFFKDVFVALNAWLGLGHFFKIDLLT